MPGALAKLYVGRFCHICCVACRRKGKLPTQVSIVLTERDNAAENSKVVMSELRALPKNALLLDMLCLSHQIHLASGAVLAAIDSGSGSRRRLAWCLFLSVLEGPLASTMCSDQVCSCDRLELCAEETLSQLYCVSALMKTPGQFKLLLSHITRAEAPAPTSCWQTGEACPFVFANCFCQYR